MLSSTRVLGVTLAAMILPAGAARAGEPYYFHKAGVTREAYTDDVNECVELAGGVRVETPHTYTPNIYAAAVAGLFSGLMKGAERRRLQTSIERTCMADKGYRRLTIDKASLKSINDLEGEARVDRLFALAAAQQPIGKELPE